MESFVGKLQLTVPLNGVGRLCRSQSVDCVSRLCWATVSRNCVSPLCQSTVSVDCVTQLCQSTVSVHCVGRLCQQLW
eukprot:gene5057-biopygen13141